MRGLLPLVWLSGAGLYTASILALLHPFSGIEDWPAPRPVNETVWAKTPLALPAALGGEDALIKPVVFVPAAKSKSERRNEWLQVGAFTTVVRSRPSAEAAPLQAYPAGRPLRVIAREGGFVRVQDLGSGQLGWVEEAALMPFNGGYRQREVAEPQIAAIAPPAVADGPKTTVLAPQQLAASAAKKIPPPREDSLHARTVKETAVAMEPSARGLFRKKRGLQHVALRSEESGMAAMIDRAIRGF
jgi:Bacterial SH3 domain